MASLNQCNFIGNVGKIESRFMTNGDAVTNLSLACNEQWKNKDGEKQEKVEWVNCVIYKKLAEVANSYVKVGNQLFVSGKLQTRKWEKDGVTRYSTEIIVHEMTMLGGKPQGEEKPVETYDGGLRNDAPKEKANSVDDFESNIPF
jgi:single-strand DNA-binding protein